MVMFAELPGPGQLVPSTIVSVDAAVPFAFKTTLTGLIDHVLHPGDGQAGRGEVVRETVPLKLLILESEIEAVPVAPGIMVNLLGFAVSVKSGPGQAAADGIRKVKRLYAGPISDCEQGAAGTPAGTNTTASSNNPIRRSLPILKLLSVLRLLRSRINTGTDKNRKFLSATLK